MRRRSRRGSVVTDVAFVANRLSWRRCLVLGAVGFTLFYWLLPMWLRSRVEVLKSEAIRVAFDHLVTRRAHWLQWVGIAIALVCVFFAARDYYGRRSLRPRSVRDTSWFARLLARILD